MHGSPLLNLFCEVTPCVYISYEFHSLHHESVIDATFTHLGFSKSHFTRFCCLHIEFQKAATQSSLGCFGMHPPTAV